MIANKRLTQLRELGDKTMLRDHVHLTRSELKHLMEVRDAATNLLCDFAMNKVYDSANGTKMDVTDFHAMLEPLRKVLF